MQPTQQTAISVEKQQKRIEAVVHTLVSTRKQGDSLAELTHDARNMVTALSLYSDLLDEPGVLTHPFLHYAGELRLIASACTRLVEKLVQLDTPCEAPFAGAPWLPGAWRSPADTVTPQLVRPSVSPSSSSTVRLPADSIENLQEELLAAQNLLDALAGPAVAVTVSAEEGAFPVQINGEDLTRVLVNLVKNAAEAIPASGFINISLHGSKTAEGKASSLVLTVEDSGPGIPANLLETVFEPGYTTHAAAHEHLPAGSPAAAHRGLGLSISRSIIEAAGGHIRAANRKQGGARIEIELPVLTR